MQMHYEKILTPIWSKEMGERLSIARMALGLSQAEIAEKLEITQSTVSKIESGRIQFSSLSLFQLKNTVHKHLAFVLVGTRKETYSLRYIIKKFWKTKLGRPSKYRRPLNG